MKHKGFTLIELSIVLVIIGLIVGGMLVGQDLIKAAELRGTISQLEKYNTAAHTFRLKYNGLPGDLKNATTFFPGVLNSNESLQGDGNKLISGNRSANTVCNIGILCIAGESATFWYMLSQAGLIDGNYTSNDYEVFNLTPSDSVAPKAKSGKGRVAVQSYNGKTYFAIADLGTSALVLGGMGTNFSFAFTPTEAFQLDSKIDDGVASTGSVLSADRDAVILGGPGSGSTTPATPTSGDDCYDTDDGNYTTNVAVLKDELACSLTFRAGF